MAFSSVSNMAGGTLRATPRGRVKDRVRRFVSRFLDYRLNWIVAQDAVAPSAGLPKLIEITPLDRLHQETFAEHPDEKVRGALSFERAGCRGFVLLTASQPACLVHFADVSNYDSRSTWPLAHDELALVNVVTLPAYRGRGFASVLIAESTASLVPSQFKRAIAYIWWNHEASLRAFRTAGWRRIGFSVEISRGNGRWHSVHIPLKRRRYFL